MNFSPKNKLCTLNFEHHMTEQGMAVLQFPRCPGCMQEGVLAYDLWEALNVTLCGNEVDLVGFLVCETCKINHESLDRKQFKMHVTILVEEFPYTLYL